MKQIFILMIITLSLIGCNFSGENRGTGKMYFDYDEIEYYENDISPDGLNMLFESQSKYDIDSFKMKILTVSDIPKDINDLSYPANLIKTGYKKEAIAPSRFPEFNKIFQEKVTREHTITSCLQVYRDILIFKKKSKVTGIAKICFDCYDSWILGGNTHIENFGLDGDFEKLEHLLKN